jgi:hypothetical protein
MYRLWTGFFTVVSAAMLVGSRRDKFIANS